MKRPTELFRNYQVGTVVTFLKINETKFQAITFNSNLKEFIEIELLVNDHAFKSTTHVKLLNVTLDYKLSFSKHVDEVCRQVNWKLACLQRIAKFAPLKCKRRLYFAYIAPHFTTAIFYYVMHPFKTRIV